MSNPFHLPDGMHVLERGWLSSNNILLMDAHDNVLIDTGYASHAPQTLALVAHVLQERGSHQHVTRIINTHLHSDHCGGNAALQARYQCRITIPEAEADKVARWDEEALSYRATGQHCERFSYHDTLNDGATLRLGGQVWQALAAPGHDPHSLIFYCAQEGLLISADALWQNGFGVIFPELEGESGFAEARATLDLISSLEVRLVIPGHGAPFEDVKTALRTAYSRLDYLEQVPLRNAQNTVKVLLKFLLLDKQAIALDTVAAMMMQVPLLQTCNRRYFALSDNALADWAVSQLIKAGAASSDGTTLFNAG